MLNRCCAQSPAGSQELGIRNGLGKLCFYSILLANRHKSLETTLPCDIFTQYFKRPSQYCPKKITSLHSDQSYDPPTLSVIQYPLSSYSDFIWTVIIGKRHHYIIWTIKCRLTELEKWSVACILSSIIQILV